MALTTDQKASFLFKQAQGVAETSMLRDFFEEAIKGRILVLNNQLWAQSDSIPATAPVLADGATSGVVQYFQARSMTAVAGVSNAFYLSDLIDSIPFNFGDGSYNYVVTSSTGTTIPFGQGDWLVNNTAGTLTFYGSVPANMPPKISFYKYIGTKGGSTGGSGVTSVNGDPGPAVVLTAASVGAVGTTGGTMTGALTMNAQNQIRFADADSSNYVGFQAPSSITTNKIWTLPSADGTDGQVLKTDGSANLSWVSIPSTADFVQKTGDTMTGTLNLSLSGNSISLQSGGISYFNSSLNLASNLTINGLNFVKIGEAGYLTWYAVTGNARTPTGLFSTLQDFSSSDGRQVTLTPYGIRFYEKSANGDNYVGLKAADSIAADVVWTLPSADGTDGQVLKTDGAGVLSWVSPGAATAGTLVHPTSNSTFEYNGYNVSMTGIFNTAIGVNAGVSITNGTANSAFGERAGYQITSGADNVAVGSRALEFTTIGSYNVAVGKMALILNTSGDRNVAVGYSALYSNVSGQSNVAIGDEASKNLTSGSSNIAIGKTAMNAIGQGSYNTHIFSGYSGGVSDGSLIYSGTVLIGSDNLGGRPADPTNNNQFILGTSNHKYIFDGGLINSLKIAPYGDTAGQTSEIRFLELGANGTNYVGFKAPDNISANKIWVLPAADGTANQVLKTDGSGNLGWVSTSSAGSITHPTTGSTFEFGTENPLMTGSGNTAIGVGSGNSITSGEFNTVYGTDAGTALTTGLRNTLIGYSSGSSLSTGGNNTFIGMFTANGLSSGSHNIVIGDATGSGLTSGSFNTLINVQTTLPSTINGTVVIGRDSGGASGTATGSNQFILGTANHSYLLAGVVNSSLVLGPTGTSTGSGGIIRFRELAANGTNSVALRAADSIVSDITWTLPSADGTTGQVLTTNGTGTLSWTTPGSTGSISHPTTASTYEFGTANPSMTGLANTAYGVGAGDSVTSGESNSFYGRDAGTAITTGIRNNLIGFSAASSLTTGSRNTIIGALTGGSLISGDYNVIIGDANGGSMSGGSYNTIINVQTSMPASMSGTVIIGTDSAGNSSTASASNQFILGHSNHKYRMPGVFESAIDLGPIGTTTGSTGIVKFRELAANGTNFVAFRAADSIAADVTWTLPSADGTNGQVLTTNGTGTLTWTTAGGGGSGTGLAHPTTGSTFETGAYNVAITGTNNTAIGSTAGDSISSGTDNTAFGTNTLTAVTTGLRNTAIGSSAGVALTTQNDNTVMGAYAVSVYTNTGVTAVGSFAGRYSNSSSSTYIGSESASVNIISGTSNSSLGYRSLYNLSSGSSNVAIGSGAGLNLQTGSQNIVIGANAGAGLSGNNYCTILAGNTLGGIGGVVAIGMDSVGNRSSATADNQFVLGTFSHKYRFPGSVETTFVLGPTGTSAGQTGTLQFRELAVNGTNAVSFRAPDAIAADVTWTLPQADGTSGQALITNGSGTLSWSTIAGSGTFPPVSSGDYDFLDSAYRRWYPKINNIGSTSGTINIDLAVANYHRLTVTGNTTLNFQNVTTSTTLAAVWQVEINFSSAATISYQLNGVSKTINWDSSTAPSFTTGKLSILSFISPNGTTSIYGNISILNATP